MCRRLREEEEEAERRRRLLAKGKHTFLKRGEGVVAASQTAKVGNVSAISYCWGGGNRGSIGEGV